MENMKKMLLVEQDFVERLKHNENLTENSSSRLDREMQKILKGKMDDREKWALYSQALQRFLHFAEADRKPFKIPIVTDGFDHRNNDHKDLVPELKKEENVNNVTALNPILPELDTTPPPDTPTQHYPLEFTPSHIIERVPKSYKQKTKTLLDNIMLHKNKIWWKPGGEVVLNNHTIPNTNIVDLVNDVIRPLKRTKPKGWEEFTLILKEIRVPASCIGNPTNAEFLKKSLGERELKELDTPFSSTIARNSSLAENASTPISSRTRDSKKKKLNWERWTPY